MARDWFGRFCVVLFLRLVGVCGSGPPVSSLFGLCRFSCIACRLCNRWHLWRCRWNGLWLWRSKRQLSKSFTVVIQPLSIRLIKPNFCFDLSHRRSTTVSLETRNSEDIIWPPGDTNFISECWKYFSRVSEAIKWEILSAREDKIRIPKRPCNDIFIL